MESPLSVADVHLVSGVASVARLAQAGFTLACVSNQPAAAKGAVSRGQLEQVHERVIELLAQKGVSLSASRLCLHHPEGSVPGLSGPCGCRKPAPGMLLDLASALHIDLGGSWMVGDTDADVAAGQAAGCRTLLIENPASAHKRAGQSSPDLRAASLCAGIVSLLESATPVGDNCDGQWNR
jgi:D-glycero-D-manno-heptose 1,7-bisphosphate phosphatase